MSKDATPTRCFSPSDSMAAHLTRVISAIDSVAGALTLIRAHLVLVTQNAIS
jgi:hypothetical protein